MKKCFDTNGDINVGVFQIKYMLFYPYRVTCSNSFDNMVKHGTVVNKYDTNHNDKYKI